MKHLRPKALAILCLLALILLLTACPQNNPPAVERETIIPATTKVPDQTTRDAQTLYDPSTGIMRFAQTTAVLDNLKTGDVFVSEPSAAAPFGYLRKVNKISKEGNEVVLETSQAALGDAISQGTIIAEATLQPAQLKSLTPLGNSLCSENKSLTQTPKDSKLSPQLEKTATFGFHCQVDEQVEVTAANNEAGADATASARLTGSLDFNVGYRLFVDINLVGTDTAEAKLFFNEKLSVAYNAKITGKIKKEVEVANITFEPITFTLVIIPIVLVPKAKLMIGIDGNAYITVDYTFNQNASYELGAHWDSKDGFKKINKTEFNMSYEGPNFNAEGNISAYAKASLQLLLYDAGGIEVSSSVGARLAVQAGDPLWVLYGFIKGDVAFVIDTFFLNERYDTELFSIEKELSSGKPLPPVITVLNSNPSVDLNFETDLGQFFKIADQVGTTYDLRSDKDGVISSLNNGANPISKFTFLTDGVRTLTINARNFSGKTAQAFFTVNVVNTPPDQPELSTTNLSVGQGDEFDLNLKRLPNDRNSGQLKCSAVRWVVSGGDSLNSSTGCSATAVFAEQGTRTVKAIVTDPQSLATESSFSISVSPEPAVKSPRIREITVEYNGGSFNIGDTATRGVSVLTASVEIANPDNLPVSYEWSVINKSEPTFTFDNLSTTPTLAIAPGQEFNTFNFGKRYICVFSFNCQPQQPKYKQAF